MAVLLETPHKDEMRGDATMEYAATYQLGNTVVHVDDSLLPKTSDERNARDQNIADACWAIWEECLERGEEI